MSKTCFALPTYKHNAAGPLNHERPSCIFPEIQDKVPFEYNIQSCVRAFSQQKGTAKWCLAKAVYMRNAGASQAYASASGLHRIDDQESYTTR